MKVLLIVAFGSVMLWLVMFSLDMNKIYITWFFNNCFKWFLILCMVPRKFEGKCEKEKLE